MKVTEITVNEIEYVYPYLLDDEIGNNQGNEEEEEEPPGIPNP